MLTTAQAKHKLPMQLTKLATVVSYLDYKSAIWSLITISMILQEVNLGIVGAIGGGGQSVDDCIKLGGGGLHNLPPPLTMPQSIV